MRRRLALATLCGALALTGCGGSADETGTADTADTATVEATTPTQEDVTTPETTGEATAEEDGAGDDGDAGTTAASPTSEPAEAGSESGPIELDISERHPNGTQLDITSITVEDRSVSVEAEFFNGGKNPILITVQGGNAITLIDDQGNAYPFIQPDGAESNESQLEVAPGESIGGTWSFLGRASDASTLTLSVNRLADSTEAPDQRANTSGPQFAVEIPLSR